MSDMLKRMSASGFRKFLTDPALYAKRYLLHEESPQSMHQVIGKAVHTFLEDHALGEMPKDAQELIRMHTPPKDIEFDDNDIPLETAERLVGYITKRLPVEWDQLGFDEVIATEQSLQKYIDNERVTTHVPILGIIDMIGRRRNKAVVVDYKTTKTFSSVTKPDPKIDYIIQGHFYMYLVRTAYREYFEEENLICNTAEFIEIKKPPMLKENAEEIADSKPMVHIVTVEWNEDMMEVIGTIINTIYRVLNGAPFVDKKGNINALPNIYDMMSGKESLAHYRSMLENSRRSDLLPPGEQNFHGEPGEILGDFII